MKGFTQVNSELFSETKSFLRERINRNCLFILLLIAIIILCQYKNEKNFNKIQNDLKMNTNKICQLFKENN